ncbi:hypothetical protein MNEG_1851 [Monoraphidium neglectum]|uniref:PAS fold domain-containing protein n=1 Tax=Monoraphidium neglectum TaxID=145388 RepID=A0A0D2K767_9CHLO|nr:hypothetical protein MNEG_1851 [Monoraphidium neglectum]KIZ06113.1 hypothetical protein MNEG_1851 [Monoraphidium neglectum]|eukprot:XP_013905132.1 hypothetical protein MNEG_1851 [Monoraphidium neglectum]
MALARSLAAVTSQQSATVLRSLASIAAAHGAPSASEPGSLRELLWGAAGERPSDQQQVHYHYKELYAHHQQQRQQEHYHQQQQHHQQDDDAPSVRGAIRRCASRLMFGLAPGTPVSVEGALQPSGQARVVTEATYPYRVVHANEAFQRASGWAPSEAHGAPLPVLLKGPETDPAALNQIQEAAAARARTCVVCVTYRKDGSSFLNHLQLSPLYDTVGHVSHLLAVSMPQDLAPGGADGPSSE